MISFVQAGFTFQWQRPGDPHPHLWIVLTDADPDDYVFVVMLVTQRPHTDATVVLAASDHPFIQHDTSVNYGAATKMLRSKIDHLIRCGDISSDYTCSGSLLQRVLLGAGVSARTPNYVADELRQRKIIP